MVANNSLLDLIKRKSPSQRNSLKLMGYGAGIFAFGVIFIISAENMPEPSLRQELLALLGTLIVGTGFFIVIGAQLNLLVKRFSKFFKE